jgi:hypothetical protein
LPTGMGWPDGSQLVAAPAMLGGLETLMTVVEASTSRATPTRLADRPHET